MIHEQGLKVIPDKYIIISSFKKQMDYPLDLDNPKTLNEKINWLKLYDRKDLYTTIADKYKVRNYIEKTIIAGIPAKVIGKVDKKIIKHV